jgi:HAD superfamily hydrolase (TIGR01509 family)
MKLKPKVILFDMDGVLVDSLDSWWISLNNALETFKYKPITKNEFIKKYWGHDLYHNLKSMNIPLKVGKFCNNIYGENTSNIKLYKETTPTLEKLNGYKKAIITNTPKDCTIQILKKFDIGKYFDLIITSDDVKSAKPDPEIILKACKMLNVKPKDVVLVGDTDSDVKAGNKAGCPVIGLRIKADFTIDNLTELVDLLL